MAVFSKFYCFTEDVAEKKHNLATDTLKVAITNVLPSLTNNILSNITQISNTNLSGLTLGQFSSNNTLGVYKLIINDFILTATGTVPTFRYVVIYNDTQVTKPLIVYSDLGSAINLVGSQTITFDFDGSGGLLTIN